MKGAPSIRSFPSSITPGDAYSFFSDIPGSAFLDSSMRTDVSEFSFIGVAPFFILKSKGPFLEISLGKYKIKAQGNPFELLRSVMGAYKIENKTPFPFVAGGIGYFSYELKNLIEDLPQKAVDDLALPDMYFVLYQGLVIFDSKAPDKYHISALDMGEDGYESPEALINKIRDIISAGPAGNSREQPYARSPAGPEDPEHKNMMNIVSSLPKKAYLEAVGKALEYIRRGDIYQVCLCRRIAAKWYGKGYELYLRLKDINPSPFSAYLNCGDHTVISSSPELFLRRRGNELETRPMKGTRARGKDEKEDADIIRELEASEKDISELLMIVDLERNDLGKISLKGSVNVSEQRRIEAFPTVFQTISIIRSQIENKAHNADLLKAVFPGGSVTGCPKIRAMEIIDELEPAARGVYTGAIGYMSFHDTMDLNMAIRTMVLKDKDLYFGIGGGIVAESDPEAEYQETLVKAEAMLRALDVS